MVNCVGDTQWNYAILYVTPGCNFINLLFLLDVSFE